MSLNAIPLRCPIAYRCKRRSDYQRVVKHIKANKAYFLNHTDHLWEVAKDCPHKVEDALWRDCCSKHDWRRYLACEVFSRWFWKKVAEAGKARPSETIV